MLRKTSAVEDLKGVAPAIFDLLIEHWNVLSNYINIEVKTCDPQELSADDIAMYKLYEPRRQVLKQVADFIFVHTDYRTPGKRWGYMDGKIMHSVFIHEHGTHLDSNDYIDGAPLNRVYMENNGNCSLYSFYFIKLAEKEVPACDIMRIVKDWEEVYLSVSVPEFPWDYKPHSDGKSKMGAGGTVGNHFQFCLRF